MIINKILVHFILLLVNVSHLANRFCYNVCLQIRHISHKSGNRVWLYFFRICADKPESNYIPLLQANLCKAHSTFHN
jgi:hypothetical protein